MVIVLSFLLILSFLYILLVCFVIKPPKFRETKDLKYVLETQKQIDYLFDKCSKLEDSLDYEKYRNKNLKIFVSTLENQLKEYRIKINRYEDYFLYLENLKNYPLLAYSEEGFNLKSQKQS